MSDYAYTGSTERVYPAYLAFEPNGTVHTLIGTPGMAPVRLSVVPEDGCWQPVDTDAPPAPDKVTESPPRPSRTTSSAKPRKGTA